MCFYKPKKTNSFLLFILIPLILAFLSPHGMIYGEEAGGTVGSWPAPPQVYGTSSILMDADTGAVLYASNAHEKLYPASITKIMTGLLAIEHLNTNDSITYTDQLLNSIPGDAAKLGLVSGETTTVKDALYALMIRSANEVAVALATQASGSESAFAELMTERAAQAGALNTHFANSTGLHDANHYTTAYDMAMIAKSAMINSEFSAIWGAENYTLAATNMSEGYRIWNRHSLLVSTSQHYYPYAIGGKTGYTDEAGRTLVTAAEKDGLKLICVIMKSDDDHIFSDTISLFDYGFNHFSKVNIKDSETRFGSGGDGIPVIRKLYGTETGIFSLSNDSILIPSSVSLSEIPYTLEFLDTPDNNIVAVITYEYGGNYLGKASLMMNLSNTPAAAISGPQKTDSPSESGTEIRETTPVNIYLLLGGGAVILLVCLLSVKLFSGKRRRTQRKKRRLYK